MIRHGKCNRCGHEWSIRVKAPVQCPNCKSIYWNKERVRPTRKPNTKKWFGIKVKGK